MVMDTNFSLTNLVGNSKYYVIIYAATIAGTGAESSIEFTTVPPRKSTLYYLLYFITDLYHYETYNSTSLLN